MSILIQILTGTKNFRILPDFQISSLARSKVIKNLIFEPNFQNNSKFLDVVKFHPLQVQSGQKSQFWAKCLTQLKISGFCQISSFACRQWSKMSVLSLIFDTNQNVDFEKCHPSQVRSGQTLYFKPNFQRDWKYLDFAKFHPSQVWSGQKSIFWARFSTQIKIFLDFVKFHPLLFQSGQHSNFLAKFAAWLKISGFCQISSFACPEWSKLSILGMILIAIENFWILPHFILCMSRVVKNVSFELNFWHKSKFLDFAKFYPSQVRSGQNFDCKPNFQRDWKYLDFAIFQPSQVWSGQKSHFWAKFSTQIKRGKMSVLS